jgi:hypothetical protein
MNVIESKDDNDKYKNLFFTDKGYNTLFNYLKNLIILGIDKQDYPFNIGPILGIPMFKYSNEVKSYQELLGRIKQLGQILGVKDISFTTDDNRKVKFNMQGEYQIT